MLSLLSISAVKSAVEICHIPKLKVKMLRAHESENEINEGEDSLISKNVRIEIENIIINLKIPKELQEILTCLVSRIGIRMLRWVKYHEEILNFSRDYSITLLTPSFFTARGIIDRNKLAKELMNMESLNVKQKYVLSCVYCFIKNVDALFQEMTDLDKKMFYDTRKHENIKQLEMVKYWTYYLLDKIDKITNEDINAYKIKITVGSGNIAVIDYFLQEMILGGEMDAIVEIAIEAIRSWERTALERDQSYRNANFKRNVPRDYFADIVYYLLSRMERSQKIEFLKRDILDDQYKFDILQYQYSRVEECLLNWPYQDYFMKTVAVMWDFLPECSYAYLLLIIIRKISVGSEEFDGEGKSFDYRRLLREFWCQSHERHKMFVLNNETLIYRHGSSIEAGVRLLISLFSLPNFTNEDKKTIQIILANATDKQKENIICSKEWQALFIMVISAEKWQILNRFDKEDFFTKKARANFKKNFCCLEILKHTPFPFFQNGKWDAVESFIKWTSLPEEDIKKLTRDIISSNSVMEKFLSLVYHGKTEVAERLISWCFPSEQDVRLFKKKFCCLEIVKHTLFPFFEDDKWDAVKSFIKWISLPEGDVKKLTRDIISSNSGMEKCLYLVYDGKTKAAERLISWCFPSEQDVRLFKSELIFSESGIEICADLILQNKLELSNKFIHFFVSSSEEIKKIKTEIAYDYGCSICKKFISSFEGVIFLYSDDGYCDKKVEFTGGKWEEVEKFITFCFSSEDEINDFKKNLLLKTSGRDIHFDLVKLCKFEEAETFFHWLGLSADEVKKLKKETLFYHWEAKIKFIELIHTELDPTWFVDYGNKDEAIELLLRWFLIDKDTVLEFRHEYLKWYQDISYTNKDDMLRNLNLIIERRLEDFDTELD